MSDKLVLVADDETSIKILVGKILEKGGYRTSLHENGLTLVEKYLEKPDDVGLVVLDLMMPQLDGGATIKRLKESGYSHNSIGMSGYAISEKEMSDLGIDFFIHKPFKPPAFLTLVRTAYKGQ